MGRAELVAEIQKEFEGEVYRHELLSHSFEFIRGFMKQISSDVSDVINATTNVRMQFEDSYISMQIRSNSLEFRRQYDGIHVKIDGNEVDTFVPGGSGFAVNRREENLDQMVLENIIDRFRLHCF